MPFTLRNLREDVADVGSNFDGAPGLEFRHATKPLGLEQSGLSYQRIPPRTSAIQGSRPHLHACSATQSQSASLGTGALQCDPHDAFVVREVLAQAVNVEPPPQRSAWRVSQASATSPLLRRTITLSRRSGTALRLGD
jgi:hypothetical protein